MNTAKDTAIHFDPNHKHERTNMPNDTTPTTREEPLAPAQAPLPINKPTGPAVVAYICLTAPQIRALHRAMVRYGRRLHPGVDSNSRVRRERDKQSLLLYAHVKPVLGEAIWQVSAHDLMQGISVYDDDISKLALRWVAWEAHGIAVNKVVMQKLQG